MVVKRDSPVRVCTLKESHELKPRTVDKHQHFRTITFRRRPQAYIFSVPPRSLAAPLPMRLRPIKAFAPC